MKKILANKKLLILVSLGFLPLGIGLVIVKKFSQRTTHNAQRTTLYYCPMHPTYTSDRPGDCPICNMKLVLREDEAQTASLAKVCLLHKCKMIDCPMELPIKPGEKVTCPVCGTHVAEAPVSSGSKALYYRHPMRPEVTSPVPKKDEMGMDYIPVYAEKKDGDFSVAITPERRQLIGLKSERVERRPLAALVRASGRVAYDPELYNAMTEYREAVRSRDRVGASPLADVRERSEALVRSSELRLRQLGLSQEQIEAAAIADSSPINLLVGGNGDSVWVYAQVYEYEIGLLGVGQEVEIKTPAFPGRSFYGKIKAVDPILSAETRSLKVRIEVPNPEGLLKLEMYVNATIKADLGVKLALPETALFSTGERQVVFIDLSDGRIEPREVRVGQEAGGYYEIISGVHEGEKVVTSANFLIDSESKLRSAFSQPKKHHDSHD